MRSQTGITNKMESTPGAEAIDAKGDTVMNEESPQGENPEELDKSKTVCLSSHLSIKDLMSGETVFTNSLTHLWEWLLDLQQGDAFVVEKLAACEGSNAGEEWQKDEDRLLQHHEAFQDLNDMVIQYCEVFYTLNNPAL